MKSNLRAASNLAFCYFAEMDEFNHSVAAAVRYWEPRRIPYSPVLLVVTKFLIAFAAGDSRRAFATRHSRVHSQFFLRRSVLRGRFVSSHFYTPWLKNRSILLVIGTLLAILLERIADEIAPK